MKMRECFRLPLSATNEIDFCGEYICNINDGLGCMLIPCVPEGVDTDAICRAVNKHDTLTAQVAELREALRALLDMDRDSAESYKLMVSCEDLIDRTKPEEK